MQETEMSKVKSGDGAAFVAAEDEDSAQDAFQRMVVASMSGQTMRRFAAAAALLITRRRGSELRDPEPLVQVGFEPSEEEMGAIVKMAKAARRDLIHVGCHDDGSGKPTGMMAVVYFEDDKAHPHRRCGLLCAPDSSNVILAGVSDVEGETCHFTLATGRKMVRVPGYPFDDIGAGMQRAGELWFERAETLDPADCGAEVLRIPGVLQGPGGPPSE
ncbi:hypothetical protein EAH79_11795 [Sphingomonas koreensis]|nr:hypothetical protein EAH79_11795 [Sphingomonas koreensis]